MSTAGVVLVSLVSWTLGLATGFAVVAALDRGQADLNRRSRLLRAPGVTPIGDHQLHEYGVGSDTRPEIHFHKGV